MCLFSMCWIGFPHAGAMELMEQHHCALVPGLAGTEPRAKRKAETAPDAGSPAPTPAALPAPPAVSDAARAHEGPYNFQQAALTDQSRVPAPGPLAMGAAGGQVEDIPGLQVEDPCLPTLQQLVQDAGTGDSLDLMFAGMGDVAYTPGTGFCPLGDLSPASLFSM